MTIPQYGVTRGRPTRTRSSTARSPHYQILIEAGGEEHRLVVNVQSVDGSEVLYFVDHDFRHASLPRLLAIDEGFHALASAPGGLALDYLRGALFDVRRLRPLPAGARRADDDLNEVLDAVVQRAVRTGADVFAFGQRFPHAGARPQRDAYFGFSPEQGIHDIHMNQGNTGTTPRDFSRDDGTWQDGAFFVHFPPANRWVAVFLAFQTQAFVTDDDGHASGPSYADLAATGDPWSTRYVDYFL
jgi:uncharacterized protein YukJ